MRGLPAWVFAGVGECNRAGAEIRSATVPTDRRFYGKRMRMRRFCSPETERKRRTSFFVRGVESDEVVRTNRTTFSTIRTHCFAVVEETNSSMPFCDLRDRRPGINFILRNERAFVARPEWHVWYNERSESSVVQVRDAAGLRPVAAADGQRSEDPGRGFRGCAGLRLRCPFGSEPNRSDSDGRRLRAYGKRRENFEK